MAVTNGKTENWLRGLGIAAVAVFLLLPSPLLAQQADQPVDDFIAERYRKEAHAGNVKAQFTLGYLHERGMIRRSDGVDSRALAIDWYRKAATGGYAAAQFRLGTLLMGGDEADRAEALSSFRKAADQGLMEAQYNLSLLLDRTGELEEAARYMEMAARQGMARAMRRMGMLHMEGRGVAQDNVMAWVWLVQAVGHGDNEAVKLVGDLDAKLSDTERENAKLRLDAEQR
ncbi:tetratricopeptide repeat protein [Aestuariispira insulae]|uniref:Sel1 repeat-containing protein n=1 Tax=Aestuariispira insulae TaxID=1461337 RepID=A0A3D9HSF0_9PROT|nr:tetratricopeptide repeat protein [Aestuariispira insulae]RED52261.1 hypothetical protein DFP90_102279 [Aestuariispira insulae]